MLRKAYAPGALRNPSAVRVLRIAAILLCLVGAGVLLYPYYTDYTAGQAQKGLSAALAQRAEAAGQGAQGAGRQVAAANETSQPSAAPAADLPPPEKGAPIGKISIPKIGVDWIFVEGTDLETLKKGPGRYSGSPLPGRRGNLAIAGHRTTYGAPFNRLDELAQGDEISVSDGAKTYLYRVSEKKIVAPSDLSVIAPTTDYRLTLTTCNPKFSARERLIIVATLENPPGV